MTEGSRLTGSLMARNVVVEGELDGSILASGRLEIGARGVVRAEVSAATVAIAQGSFFEGKVHMTGGGQGAGSHQTFEEKRHREPDRPA
jgi:cytoskeletal protein CcmA (bactofilin family)